MTRGSQPPPYPPRATLRLQFNPNFTLDDAVELVDWAADLGISHVYASPLLTARAGSAHGYDIVDHQSVNPELGGEDALHRLVAALRGRGMGLILDIVPNHMGVGGHDNAWWLDVLEWGRASPYAAYFDIDFDPPDTDLRNKVMVPFLGDTYGACLNRGDIVLRVDPARGSLDAWYHDHRFPIRPADYASVLTGTVEPDIGPINRATAAAIRQTVREAAAQSPDAIATDLARFAPDAKGGTARLHMLLERQHFRLVWWRAAADEINWRRFFDINTLAGLRVEVPRVFEATHTLIFGLYAKGLIDGVRIDHVDGLAEPRAYCRKLHRRLAALTRQRPADAGQAPPLIWVEKILAPGEALAADWLVDGTTGYDFMDQVGALLHDPNGEAPLTALWTNQTARSPDFHAEARIARRGILRNVLSSELNATAAAVRRVARQEPATRDFSLTAIRRALTELLVNFPVYRLYAGAAGQTATDEPVIATALAAAMSASRRGDRHLLPPIAQWLAADPPRAAPLGYRRQERHRARVRFQQLSAPTAAKAVEDTAFYRYGRLLSRNEVGSDPAVFALSPDAFHAMNIARLARFPRGLLATATHDHKRGEDARARLAVISEWPETWAAFVAAITDEQPLGDVMAGDRLMLLQTLVGVWPLTLDPDDDTGIATMRDRVAGWQQKALREAKLRTDWATPDAGYEAACHADLEALLASGPARAMIAGFVGRIAVPGAVNALSQSFLRLTAPGIPDLYQGAAGWDFSLVDPDNRHPPDYAELRAMQTRGPGDTWRDGGIKQAMIGRTLQFRAACPALFSQGDYVPVALDGRCAAHAVAFLRVYAGRRVLAAAVRLPGALLGHDAAAPRIAPDVWQDTRFVLPPNTRGVDQLTGCEIGPAIVPHDAFARLPVALIELS